MSRDLEWNLCMSQMASYVISHVDGNAISRKNFVTVIHLLEGDYYDYMVELIDSGMFMSKKVVIDR